MNIDLLIHAKWIVPVDADESLLENHSIAIQTGRITDILPTAESKRKYTADEEIDLPGQVLIPGLINAHTHASMSLLRGLADDLPLMEWLSKHIWPAEQRWVSEEFIHDGTLLAVAEMLKGGTTCFNDMYFFPEVTGRAAASAGIRATVGLIVLDFPSVWAENASEYLSRGLEVADQFRNHPLIKTAFAPHAPYTVSDEPLERIRVLADELDIPIHMHLHETTDEVTQSLNNMDKRPMQRLADLGLLSTNYIAVHMTQLNDQDKQIYAQSGGHVVHCPESNLKLASGFCPVADLLERGINVAIGTDGAASNNDLDMFSEMRTTALLAKGVAANAAAVPAYQALRMATLNGAIALNIDQETGSLAVGKSADIVAVDLNTVSTQPVYSPVSQLVYACGKDNVSNVWVAGQRLVNNQELTTLDQNDILEKAEKWKQRIQAEKQDE